MAKRFFWLKLMEDFFQQPKIKKLRRIAGGDTYTVIYLKMQLLSLKNDGMLFFEGTEDNFIDEIALTIDESEDNVRFTIMYLLQQGLMEEISDSEYAMIDTMKNIGSETSGAERVRQFRERKKAVEALQCNVEALLCNSGVTECNTEKEKEKEKEIELKRKENNTFIPDGMNTVGRKSRKNSISKNANEQAFEELWELYPRKQGSKANAYRDFEKALKDGVTVETIRNGLEAAVKHWKDTKTDKQFIPMGSTWFHQRRWMDDLSGSAETEGRHDRLGSQFKIEIMG